MTNDLMLGSLYILMAIMLVAGSLMVRRERAGKLIAFALAWVVIFAAGFVIMTFRDDLGYLVARMKTEATGQPLATDGQIRIPKAIDGHFYVTADLNGVPVKFLVDSGATVTTISRRIAARAEVPIYTNRMVEVQTGNGLVRVATGRADTLSVGTIQRSNLGVHITGSGGELNVLGMNFLSSLERWGVEGRWLILEG